MTISEESAELLSSAHPLLQRVFREVADVAGLCVLCTYRGRVAQEAAFEKGTSKAHFKQSPHNYKPSLAIDVIPKPFNGWDDIKQFYDLAEVVMQKAIANDVPLLWGAAFKQPSDYPHYELHNWRTLINN